MDSIKVIIVDDHQLIREGLRKILAFDPEISVVAEAGDGEQAVKLAGEYNPQVILMDINLPLINGVEASKRIKKLYPQIGIVVLTIHDDQQYVAEALKTGLEGYVLKDVGADQLIEAIKIVAKGGSYLDPGIASKVLNSFKQASRRQETEDRLTSREMEVLKLIAGGRSNKEIASELYISEKTVKNHLTNIFRKIEVEDRTQAAVYAIKQGLINV